MDLSWHSRLHQVREALNLSQRDLAGKLGVTGTAWQNYESGKNVPGGSVLKALFDLGVNMNWLFSGEGEMFLPTARRQIPVRAAEEFDGPALEELQRQIQERFLADIGLTDIAPLAAIGESMTEYAVLVVLARWHPETRSLEEVKRELEVRGMTLESPHLLAFLHLLRRRGILRLESGPALRFGLNERTSKIVTKDFAGHTQLAIGAVRTILREVLPRSSQDPSLGSIMQIRLSAEPERAEALLKELRKQVIHVCEGSVSDLAPSEVAVVLAVSHISSPEYG